MVFQVEWQCQLVSVLRPSLLLFRSPLTIPPYSSTDLFSVTIPPYFSTDVFSMTIHPSTDLFGKSILYDQPHMSAASQSTVG